MFANVKCCVVMSTTKSVPTAMHKPIFLFFGKQGIF